ncbi:MAG: DUF5701 family protein [bacterium]|nr:DUF5701 family protein [bacterium]
MSTIITNTAPAILKKLFDERMEALRKAELATEVEIKPLFSLLVKVRATHEGKGRIPFTIIPQRSGLPFYERMTKVSFNGNPGVTYIYDEHRIINPNQRIPRGHYLMAGIEDGRGMLGVKPSVCLQQFDRFGRFPCTAAEGITMAMYEPEILRHHYLNLTGTVYDGNRLLCLFLNGKIIPWLGAVYGDYSAPQYGSPSCEGRLSLSAY